MTSKPLVFAIASSREKMEQALRKFYCSESATFTADGYVSNGTRILGHVRVEPYKKTGFRFIKP